MPTPLVGQLVRASARSIFTVRRLHHAYFVDRAIVENTRCIKSRDQCRVGWSALLVYQYQGATVLLSRFVLDVVR